MSKHFLFKLFYLKKKVMLSAVTLSESTLMLTIHFIKHTLFINFGENRKDTNGAIIFDIKFDLLFLFLFLITAFSNIKCF